MGFIAQQAVAQQLLQHEATAKKSLSESEYGFRVIKLSMCITRARLRARLSMCITRARLLVQIKLATLRLGPHHFHTLIKI
jgi:hypothetical protein